MSLTPTLQDARVVLLASCVCLMQNAVLGRPWHLFFNTAGPVPSMFIVMQMLMLADPMCRTSLCDWHG